MFRLQQSFHVQVLKRHKIPHLHNLFCKNRLTGALCHQHAGSSNCLDLLLGPSAEEFSLDDDGLLGQFAFTKNFVVTLETKRCKLNQKQSKYSARVKKKKKRLLYRELLLQVHTIPDHQFV